MPTFDDTQLMAYADGELPAHEAAAITAALADDPALAARVERFAASRRVMKRAFAPPAAMPLSPALLKLLAPPAAVVASRSTGRRRARWPMALAASLLLGLGAMSGTLLLRPAPDALSLALETLPSGAIQPSADGGIAVLSTLAADDGSLCREYERGTARGLACRAGDGRWQPRALPPTTPASEGGYQLAAGGELDAATALKARRLGVEDERRLLSEGWRD